MSIFNKEMNLLKIWIYYEVKGDLKLLRRKILKLNLILEILTVFRFWFLRIKNWDSNQKICVLIFFRNLLLI